MSPLLHNWSKWQLTGSVHKLCSLVQAFVALCDISNLASFFIKAAIGDDCLCNMVLQLLWRLVLCTSALNVAFLLCRKYFACLEREECKCLAISCFLTLKCRERNFSAVLFWCFSSPHIYQCHDRLCFRGKPSQERDYSSIQKKKKNATREQPKRTKRRFCVGNKQQVHTSKFQFSAISVLCSPSMLLSPGYSWPYSWLVGLMLGVLHAPADQHRLPASSPWFCLGCVLTEISLEVCPFL